MNRNKIRVLRSYFERGDSPLKIAAIYLILSAASLVSLYPLLYVFKASLLPHQQFLSDPFTLIPPDPTLDNYREALWNKPTLLWTWNSLKVALATATLSVAVGSVAAYAFSRWSFVGRRLCLTLVLTAQMFPIPMLLLPMYLALRKLDLLNTHAGLVIPYLAGSLPFVTWMLKGYFDTIPFELEESAFLEGATPLAVMGRVVLPLALPSLAVSGIFAFMMAWTEYIVARVILTRPELYTLPIGLVSLQNQYGAEWGTYSAAAILTSLPVIIVFVWFGRYLISGLTAGSVKG